MDEDEDDFEVPLNLKSITRYPKSNNPEPGTLNGYFSILYRLILL